MSGLTPTGLQIKRLNDIIEEFKTNAEEIFGDLVADGDVVDTSDNSVLGRLIGLVSPADADIWEAIAEVHDAFNPNAAYGIALDNLVMLGGVTRFPASRTRLSLIVQGSTGSFLPISSKVSSAGTGKTFSLLSPVGLTPEACSGVGINLTAVTPNTDYILYFTVSGDTTPSEIKVTSSGAPNKDTIYNQFIDLIQNGFSEFKVDVQEGRLFVFSNNPFQLVSYTASPGIAIEKVVKPAVAIADEFGPITQVTNSVTTIATPVFGWDSVYNPEPATVGRLRETDEELRERFRNTKFDKATNTLESLYSALNGIPGIEDFIIYENDTDQWTAEGIPPHSFLPIVDSGVASEIAQAIWDNKPVGILSAGNTTVTVIDSQGFGHDISFSRPVVVNLHIRIGLTIDAKFPQGGEDSIRDAIINSLTALRIGDNVTYTRLYTPINSVIGHQVDSLMIGTSAGNLSMANIEVPYNGKIRILRQNITFV